MVLAQVPCDLREIHFACAIQNQDSNRLALEFSWIFTMVVNHSNILYF